VSVPTQQLHPGDIYLQHDRAGHGHEDHDHADQHGDHTHEHSHHEHGEPEQAHTGEIQVPVLDIGADKGALVIYADKSMLGREIEICPVGDLPSRSHNVVRARQTMTHLVYAAVFPALAEGDYSILSKDGAPTIGATIAGGRVTEIDRRTNNA